MRAMLLAAGYGERLLPLTRSIPKPALPVLGRPLAVQILRRLAEDGIGSVVMNLHHLPDALTSLLGDGTALGLDQLHYSHEEVLLGTAGGVRHAARFLRGEGTILVRNADFLADIDLEAAAEAHLAAGCPATLVLAPAREGFPVVEVDEAGIVLSIAGQPKADRARAAGRYLFTGCHLMEEEVLDLIPPSGPSDIVRDVYRRLAGDARLGSHLHRGFWREFGAPVGYLEGSLDLLSLPAEMRRRIAETDPVRTVGEAEVAVGPGADFHQGVTLRGRVALGFASLVAEGTTLEDSVVLAEAWIGPGCRFRRAVVGPGAEVPAGFEAENALVCADDDPKAPLPLGTERRDGILVRPLETAGG